MDLPDPNELIAKLEAQIRPVLGPHTALVGIHTGGVWVMQALIERLGFAGPCGELDIAFYRDDFSRIGLHPQVRPSRVPFEVEDCDILLIDDVLYTGRTVRAAMNLLFDYGRPARIRLAVLIDRGGHELPIRADFAAASLPLTSAQHVSLQRDAVAGFRLVLKEGAA